MITELRSELAKAADKAAAPEDTGPEISAAFRQQLDTYQSKAKDDAETIEDCVQKLGDLTIKSGEQEEDIRNLQNDKLNLESKLRHTQAELETLKKFPENSLAGDANGIRGILETQGSMAGELATKELQIQTLEDSVKDSLKRVHEAEENSRQMAEQMKLIKTTSEEVALLEAEEIERLEGEVLAMRSSLADNKKSMTEARKSYEKKIAVLSSDLDKFKAEVLRMKRLNNENEEKLAKATRELDSMRGHAVDVTNRLHSVQFSNHARDVVGSSPTASGLASTGGGYLSGVLTAPPHQPLRQSQSQFKPAATAASVESLMTLAPSQNISHKYTSELELLYIQREKELLAKLADAMTKVRVYEDGKSTSTVRRNSLDKAGGGSYQKLKQSTTAANAANPPPPPSSTSNATKRPRPVGGLHQPTKSSMAKRVVKGRFERKLQTRAVGTNISSSSGSSRMSRGARRRSDDSIYYEEGDYPAGDNNNIDKNNHNIGIGGGDNDNPNVNEGVDIGGDDSYGVRNDNDNGDFKDEGHAKGGGKVDHVTIEKAFFGKNYYDPAITPVPYDKQQLNGVDVMTLNDLGGRNTAFKDTPYSSVSATSFPSSRTPLDDLKEKLLSGTLLR